MVFMVFWISDGQSKFLELLQDIAPPLAEFLVAVLAWFWDFINLVQSLSPVDWFSSSQGEDPTKDDNNINNTDSTGDLQN